MKSPTYPARADEHVFRPFAADIWTRRDAKEKGIGQSSLIG